MAGSLALALVVAGLAAWLVARPDTYVARTPDVARPSALPAQAAQVLRGLEGAVADADPDAARALAPAGDAGAQDLLRAVATNAAALRVRDFTARYVDESGAVAADGSWTADVALTWRFSGFDRAPVSEEVRIGFAPDASSVRIDAIGGGDRRTPLWLAGPLQVRRDARTLVLVDGSAATADTYAERARAAVPVVRRVVPAWRPRLVVEVPASVEGLDRALDAAPGTYDDIAAVSAPVDGSATPDSPVHVFVNPAVYGALDPVGAQVVMSHEATHVATNAPFASMPPWLLEGFADYVALRDVDLPLSTTAGQIIAQVQADGPPAALPAQSDFDATDGHLGAVYESAWLVCRVLADRGGEAALVALYDALDGGADLAPELRRLFGWTPAQLTTAWRQRLAGLAAAHG